MRGASSPENLSSEFSTYLVPTKNQNEWLRKLESVWNYKFRNQNDYMFLHTRSDVLPCVRNVLSYTSYLIQGPRLVT